MIERMTECGPPNTVNDIGLLEEQLGIRLPDAYKSFLARFNGGRPEPDGFEIVGMDNNPNGSIQMFLRIGGPVESSTLAWNYNTLQGQIPPELFPIARTGCGDLICIIIAENEISGPVGAVVLWDYHAAWGNSGLCYDIYLIANTFEEFIGDLHEVEGSIQ